MKENQVQTPNTDYLESDFVKLGALAKIMYFFDSDHADSNVTDLLSVLQVIHDQQAHLQSAAVNRGANKLLMLIESQQSIIDCNRILLPSKSVQA